MRYLILLLLLGAQARACSVPVFRYALERWPPSLYEVHVFHKGPLSAADRARLAALEGGDVPLNAVVRALEVSEELTTDQKALLARRPADAPLPWVIVPYPDADPNARPIWSGPLAELPNLGESPLRKRIAEQLCRGESVVWLFLSGSDDAANRKAEAMLRAETARLMKTLKLPEPDAADLKTGLPLRLSFAVERIERTGPEAALARELLDADDDLRQATGPIVFPVFGRGRVLSGMHGKGLTAQSIGATAEFLCGPCSCRAKEQIDGIDLLIRADWAGMLDLQPGAEEPDRPVPTSPPIPPGSRPAPAAEPKRASSWLLPGTIIGGMAAMLAACVVLWRRGK